jgi:hypothetical protein
MYIAGASDPRKTVADDEYPPLSFTMNHLIGYTSGYTGRGTSLLP